MDCAAQASSRSSQRPSNQWVHDRVDSCLTNADFTQSLLFTNEHSYHSIRMLTEGVIHDKGRITCLHVLFHWVLYEAQVNGILKTSFSVTGSDEERLSCPPYTGSKFTGLFLAIDTPFPM